MRALRIAALIIPALAVAAFSVNTAMFLASVGMIPAWLT